MTGHLLQTMNPEAAAELHEVPEVGARVIYFARPGQGRGGQTKFPADVLFADPRKGSVTLWVLFGREDYREIEHVRRRSDQEPYGTWDHTEESAGLLAEIDILREKNEELQQQIYLLQAQVFGDFEHPKKADGSPKSIIDILAEFEKRVFAADRAKK